MSKNKLCFLIIAAFVPLVLSAQIQVRLHQPPPNQLKIEHLWWVDLDNTTQLSYTVYLYAEIIEAQKGLIFKARSNSFKLTLGKKRITPKDITDVSNVWYASKYRDYIIRTGSVPEGTYTVCIYVMQEHTGSELGKHCITLPVYLAGAPRLISPQGGSKLKQKHPHFSWTTPAPQPPNVQVRYKIRVVEVLKGQTKEEAMGANVPWFEKGGLTTMSLGYPASARPLEKTKEYAWQIQAIDASGFPVGKNQGRSEIWQFEYAHREHPVVSAIPKLTVSRTAKREGNYYKVTLTIENSHSVNIRDLQIEDRSKGFQCINKFYSGLGTSGSLGPAQACSVITNFNGKSSCLICQQSTLGGNRTIRIRYFVVPVLYSSAGVPRIIGDSLVISYRVGDSYYSDYFENLPGCTPPTPDPAFANADYLIVTHPSKLFINNSPNRNDVNKLLSLTAELAKEKNGVLGYISFPAYAYALRNLIRESPPGSWYEKLAPFDYLLLVGETEIVPSFYMEFLGCIEEDGSRGKIHVRLSDNPYADIYGNDGKPELRVGRIIGNTAHELLIPIMTSINVHRGILAFDRSNALVVTGGGDIQQHCEAAGDQLRNILHDNQKLGLGNITMVYSGQIAGDNLCEKMEAIGSEVKNGAVGKDIIAWMGHGGPGSWGWCLDAFVSRECPHPTAMYVDHSPALGFGTVAPMVFAASCFTGYYEGASFGYCEDGENGIAEAFLKKGAAVYVGCNRSLSGASANEFQRQFFENYWTTVRSVGDALFILKNHLINVDINDPSNPGFQEWLRVCHIFNLYGDPKFGGE